MADFLPVSIRYPNYEQLWLASVVTSNSTTWDPGQFVSAAKPPPTACRPRTVPPASGKLQRCSIVDRLFSLLHVAMSGQEWLKAEDPKVHINNSALSSPLITAKPGCPDRKEAGCPPPSYHHLNRSPKQNEKWWTCLPAVQSPSLQRCHGSDGHAAHRGCGHRSRTKPRSKGECSDVCQGYFGKQNRSGCHHEDP